MSTRAGNLRRPADLAAAVRGEEGYEELAERLVGLGLSGECGIDEWVDDLVREDQRAETVAAYLGEIMMYTDWFADQQPGRDPGASTVTDIEAYRDHLFAAGLSSSTVRVALASLRSYFYFRDDIDANPAAEVPLPKAAPPVPRAYTRRQAQRLLETILVEAQRAAARGDLAGQLIALRDHAIVAIMIYAGLRRGEVRRLRRGNLHLDRHALDLVGKGGKHRTLTIPPVLVAILDYYLQHVRGSLGTHEHVFAELTKDPAELADPRRRWRLSGATTNLNRMRTEKVLELAAVEDDSYGLDPWTINNRLYSYARRAGLDGPHGSHRLRHTHASLCLQAGMTLNEVAERLGHDLADNTGWQPATYRYLHLPNEFLHEVVEESFDNQAISGSPALLDSAGGADS